MGINWLLHAPCRIQLKAKIQLGQLCSVDLDPMLTWCILKRSDLPSWRSRPCLQVISVMCVVVGTLQLYIARHGTCSKSVALSSFMHILSQPAVPSGDLGRLSQFHLGNRQPSGEWPLREWLGRVLLEGVWALWQYSRQLGRIREHHRSEGLWQVQEDGGPFIVQHGF
jgi:hypothetical protein